MKTSRKFSHLVRKTERQLGLRFPKKPTLKPTPSGKPRGHLFRDGKHEVIIPKRMARNEKASESAIRHELRELYLLNTGFNLYKPTL